ncbi:MAG: hypothetical protein E7455_01030 [Ruminococcaceae bacterium]|nr:hypothetical protein [Oscillospiraceae bacterium]
MMTKASNLFKRAMAIVCAMAMIVGLCAVMGTTAHAENSGMTVTTPQWTPNDDLSVLVDGIQSPDPNAADSVLIAYGEEGLVQINVDMGDLTTINQINLFHNWQDEGYRPTDIAIDVQYENGYWERVAEKHNISWTNSWDTHVFVFKTVEVKAVRITTNNARNGEGGYRLNEIEFCNYAENASEDTWTGIEEPDDEAYAIPVTEPAVPSEPAAPTVTVTTPQWTPDGTNMNCLVDGIQSPDPTAAESALIANGEGNLVQIDVAFSELTTINQINLFHNWQDESHRPSDLAIDVQYENGLWERVAEKHNIGWTNSWDTLIFVFKTVDVQAVRIIANNTRCGAGGYRLNEIEFCNYAENASEDTWTGIEEPDDEAYAIPVTEPAVPSEPAAPTVTVTTPQWTPDDLSCLVDGNSDPNNAPSGLIAYGEAGLVQVDVAFSELKTINQINLFHNFQDETFRPSDLAIDVQYENGLWERVAEKHNITELWPTGGQLHVSLVFKTVEVQAVRITTNNARNGEGGYRLNEIEFCNYAENASEDTWTGIEEPDDEAYAIPVTEPAVPSEPTDPEPTEPDNLLLDATVTTPNWYPESNPPSNLNDGEASPDPSVAGSTLCVFDDNKLCYFDFTLPEAKDINQVKVCFNWQDTDYRAKDIAIDVQLEDGTWVRVAEMHDVQIYPDVEDFDLLFTFEAVKAKVVRVTGNGARDEAPGWRLVEVEGYMNPDVTEADYTGTEKDANGAYNIPELTPDEGGNEGDEGGSDDEVVLDNLLLGATVTTPNWYPESNPPSNLNDGEASPDPAVGTTTLTTFNDNNLCWFDFTLSEAKDINQVKVCFNWQDVEYRAKDIAIDVQLEDGTWVRVAEMHDVQIYPDVEDFDLLFTFETVKAKVVRVTGNGARDEAPGWRLVEVEGYMNPDVTEADYTGTDKDTNDAYNIPLYSNDAEPEDPTEPENPTEPEPPVIPDTGDNSMISLCCAILALGAVGIVADLGLRKKEKR